MEPRLKWNK